MSNPLHAPLHSPARPNEAPEGVQHRYLIALEGYYRWDDPHHGGERWSWACYDQEYEGGRRACMRRENFLSDLDALQAAEQYCGVGTGFIRYTYEVQGLLRVSRRNAGKLA